MFKNSSLFGTSYFLEKTAPKVSNSTTYSSSNLTIPNPLKSPLLSGSNIIKSKCLAVSKDIALMLGSWVINTIFPFPLYKLINSDNFSLCNSFSSSLKISKRDKNLEGSPLSNIILAVLVVLQKGL